MQALVVCPLRFLDALHLVPSGKAERFATFDEALVRQARKLGVQPPVSGP